MRLDLPWGSGTTPVELPEDLRPVVVGACSSSGATGRATQEYLLARALEQAPRERSLRTLLRDHSEKLFVIVNDATRPTPTAAILAAIIAREPSFLDAHGSAPRFLVATGAHSRGGEADLGQIFGPLLPDIPPQSIIWHDARDAKTHVNLGTTSRGTPVLIDRLVAEASGLVLINSVEPHYFAGYTGGRKSLVPGCAAYETISANHRLALEPGALALELDNNPVHRDLEEAIALLGDRPHVAVQVVLDGSHQLASAHVGNLRTSFHAATASAARQFAVDLPQQYDVVVSCVPYPMDYDLYQAQKGIDNGALATRDDGVLILVAQCRNGVGGRAFFELLSGAPTPADALESIRREWVLGYHKAAHIARVAERVKLWGVTELPPEVMSAAFVRPFLDVQSALTAAFAVRGNDASVLVLLDGGLTVPRVEPTSATG